MQTSLSSNDDDIKDTDIPYRRMLLHDMRVLFQRKTCSLSVLQQRNKTKAQKQQEMAR